MHILSDSDSMAAFKHFLARHMRNLAGVFCSSLVFAVAAGFATTAHAQEQEPIKIGILHSLSGTMAISEVTLMDTMLMLIENQNQRGGILGRQLQPVVVDPKSNWPLYEVKMRQLLERDKVAVVFGGWTSVSRKTVLPVVEELNGLLFYPVQYEGEESSRNIFYTGASPNQQAIPAVEYLMEQRGVERWVLVGTDYVYPRTTNRIIESYLDKNGVSNEDIMVRYTPFGFSSWNQIVRDLKSFANKGRKTAVVSTINGDANISFYNELAKHGVSAKKIPVLAFSVGEEEMAGIDTKPLVGHLAAWNYFMSVNHPRNSQFISKWHSYIGDFSRVTNDPMEAHYIGFNLWLKAVEKAGTVDTDKVTETILGMKTVNLTGGEALMLENHHITKPVFIGEIQEDGQFDVIWKSDYDIAGDAWSDYLEESVNFEANWGNPVSCGRNNKMTGACENGN
jgi:urea transport system substrate-binding protein